MEGAIKSDNQDQVSWEMDTSELELADAGSWLVTITDVSQGHEYLSFELIIAAGCTLEDPSSGIIPNVQLS